MKDDLSISTSAVASMAAMKLGIQSPVDLTKKQYDIVCRVLPVSQEKSIIIRRSECFDPETSSNYCLFYNLSEAKEYLKQLNEIFRNALNFNPPSVAIWGHYIFSAQTFMIDFSVELFSIWN